MAGDIRYVRNKYIELADEMKLDYSKDVFGEIVSSEDGCGVKI
ncbi:hypothetical protein [Pedobacter immunditicola]